MPSCVHRLILLCLLSIGSATAAERTRLPIERMPVDGALTQNSITDMLQDRSGLMWFATLGGVNVYDGYQFRAINSDPRDPDSLSGVSVAELFEDREGRVWIGGFLGWLDRYDPHTGKVTHLPRELFAAADRPLPFAPMAMWQDPQGQVWLGTSIGLHRYDPRSNRIALHVDRRAGRALLDSIREIVPVGDGRLWIGSANGLFRYDPRSGALEQFSRKADDVRTLPGNSIIKLHQDADGTLWVGTSAGLARRDADGRFTRFVHDPADPRSLGGNWVMDILRDREGRLWVASQTGGGLSLFVPRAGGGGDFEVFRNDTNDSASLAASDIWSLFEDRSGLVWVGTAGLGPNRINPSTHRFATLRAIPFSNNSLRSSFVWDMVQARDGAVWMATLAGLESFDPASGRFRYYTPHPGDIAASQMQSLHIDRAGRYWVGAIDGHLYRFDPRRGEFQTVRLPGRSDDRFSRDRIWHIGGGPDGRLWLSTLDELIALDPATAQVVERIPANPRLPLGATAAVRASLVDSDGVLWLGGGGAGLIRYEQGKGITRILSHEAGNPGTLSDNGVRSLYEGRDGTLWIGTQNGLNRLAPADRRAGRNRMQLYTRREGLPNNTVYGILPDGSGNLWLSTNRGLSHLDVDSGTLRNFDARDGLAGDEMNGGAELVGLDGTLYFGGVNGVNYFRPGSIPLNPYVPQVRISGVGVAGRAQGEGGVTPPTTMELPHDRNDVSLSFAAMDFHQPTRNRFRWRLGHQAWVETDRNSVNLARLGAGSYRFEVLGSNNDGVWSRQPATLDIRVHAPWWATPSAYAGYLVAALLLVGLYDRSLRRKLARERRFSEELASAHSLAEANHQLALRHAQYDHLTQLPNRVSLLDALGRYLRTARSEGGRVALFLLNLDRFQRLNDTIGHALGDKVLRVTSERLAQQMGRDDLLARLGSDEFALVAVAPSQGDIEAWLTEVATRLQAAVAIGHEQMDAALAMTAGIGIAVFDGSLETDDGPGDLLGFANIALHGAKREGPGQVRRYQAGMMESARERLSIEGRMHRALEQDEFLAYYQPLVDARTRKLAGFEALIRWQPPGEAMIFPDQFIPVAEESGLIVELGNLMIRAACRQLATWQRWDIAVAVNVSLRQLRSGTLVPTIQEALRSNAVPAHCLKVEITESAMMENADATAEQLRAIKALGVGLSIDDFGTGFSSLSHLKLLPVDEMKIDRSFVADLASNKHSQKIVASIIRLAHELQLRVVAEGVEEESALKHLRGLGCDLAQGYFFDRPRPAAQLEERGWLDPNARVPLAATA